MDDRAGIIEGGVYPSQSVRCPQAKPAAPLVCLFPVTSQFLPSIYLYTSSKAKEWERQENIMEGQGQLIKSRVVRVDSEASWDYNLSHANNQGCPVFVHFTASWCAPSVAMNPFFEELAHCHQDIFFMLVDVDEAKAVAKKMKVKAMPTFMLIMKGGKTISKLVGANPEEIRRKLEIAVASNE